MPECLPNPAPRMVKRIDRKPADKGIAQHFLVLEFENAEIYAGGHFVAVLFTAEEVQGHWVVELEQVLPDLLQGQSRGLVGLSAERFRLFVEDVAVHFDE